MADEKQIDKIQRLVGSISQIRNICIAAHIDHGKTTFSDNLLSGAGMLSENLAGKSAHWISTMMKKKGESQLTLQMFQWFTTATEANT